MSTSSLTPEHLEYLKSNIHRLSEEDRAYLSQLAAYKDRGFRTNHRIQAIRPCIHPKQRIFLGLEDREVLYGGSAGCGKSDALLLSAMQYIDVPDYSAIIFRKTFVDLSQAGALMDRARSWFKNTDAHWSAHEKSWIFPCGKGKNPSRLAFAYMQNEDDRYNYQGSEFQFVGFDELTQHSFECYSYLFSRLRRLESSKVPIRMRSTSNPGGKYYEWVMENFLTEEYLKSGFRDLNRDVWSKRRGCGECNSTGLFDSQPCIYCEGRGFMESLFVPARLADNPSIDRAKYLQALINLTPIERQRLEFGDWSITDQGDLFKEEWMRFYDRVGDHYRLHRPNGSEIIAEKSELIFFITADTASVEKTLSDFTCISTWAYHNRTGSLLLIHTLMSRMEVPKISDAIINQSAAGGTSFVMVEHAQCGIGVIQELRGPKGKGMAVVDYKPGMSDKVDRATTAINKMQTGQIYFPSGRPSWFDAPHAQLIGFNKATHDDFVDTVSMAAHWVHSRHQIGGGAKPGFIDRPGF